MNGWLLPSKIAESETASLGHGLYGYGGGSIYKKKTIKNKLLAFTQKDSNETRACLKVSKSQKIQQNVHLGFVENIWLARFTPLTTIYCC
jgi:hypothetical protein